MLSLYMRQSRRLCKGIIMLSYQQLVVLIDTLMNNQGLVNIQGLTKKQTEDVIMQVQRRLAEDKIMQSVYRALDAFSR